MSHQSKYVNRTDPFLLPNATKTLVIPRDGDEAGTALVRFLRSSAKSKKPNGGYDWAVMDLASLDKPVSGGTCPYPLDHPKTHLVSQRQGDPDEKFVDICAEGNIEPNGRTGVKQLSENENEVFAQQTFSMRQSILFQAAWLDDKAICTALVAKHLLGLPNGTQKETPIYRDFSPHNLTEGNLYIGPKRDMNTFGRRSSELAKTHAQTTIKHGVHHKQIHALESENATLKAEKEALENRLAALENAVAAIQATPATTAEVQ